MRILISEFVELIFLNSFHIQRVAIFLFLELNLLTSFKKSFKPIRYLILILSAFLDFVFIILLSVKTTEVFKIFLIEKLLGDFFI